MMIDQELFDLCKQVYEATGWPQELNISQLYEYWDDHDELCVISIEDSDDELVPSYTSDYLLEKLPKHVDYLSLNQNNKLTIDSSNGEKGKWYAHYWLRSRRLQVSSDTPLKALLELTIALSEAGELK